MEESFRYFKNPANGAVHAFNVLDESQVPLMEVAINEKWPEVPDHFNQMQAEMERDRIEAELAFAKQQAAKASALDKLSKLGLTQEEVSALVGG
jgi:hypothetical protein